MDELRVATRTVGVLLLWSGQRKRAHGLFLPRIFGAEARGALRSMGLAFALAEQAPE